MKTTIVEASRKFVFDVSEAPLTTRFGARDLTLDPHRVTLDLRNDRICMIVLRGITVRRDGKRGCAHDAVWTAGDSWRHLPGWLENLARGTGFPLEDRRRVR